MNEFRLVISSPDGTIFDRDITNISLRGANGDLAVMAGHIPFITSVKPGECKITYDGEEKLAEVEGGLLTVAGDKTTLLSGSFKWK